MIDLSYITVHTIFIFIIIFTRVTAIIIALPGISEMYIPAKIRFILSFFISIILVPSKMDLFPTTPVNIIYITTLICGELIVGIFIGLSIKILLNTMSIVGNIVSTQSGLGAAMLFDPNQGAQSAIIGNFLSMIAITLFFITDMHHIFIAGLHQTYELFIPGRYLEIGDMAETIIKIAAKSFEIAVKLSSPIIVVTILLMCSAGILSKLMPAIQIFFIVNPAQIIVSFIILMLTLSVTFNWYLDFVNSSMENLILWE